MENLNSTQKYGGKSITFKIHSNHAAITFLHGEIV
jgi:hypothetical protein